MLKQKAQIVVDPEAEMKIQEILDKTDWRNYDACLEHLCRIPRCPVFDGTSLCRYWREWLASGRALFPNTKEGESQYIKYLLRQDEIRFKEKLTRGLIRRVLKEERKYIHFVYSMKSP